MTETKHWTTKVTKQTTMGETGEGYW